MTLIRSGQEQRGGKCGYGEGHNADSEASKATIDEQSSMRLRRKDDDAREELEAERGRRTHVQIRFLWEDNDEKSVHSEKEEKNARSSELAV